MNDREVRELSEQQIPLVKSVRELLYMTGVHIEPWRSDGLQPGYDHHRNEFSFRLSDRDSEAPSVYFSNIRPRPGVRWMSHIVETRVLGKELVSLDTATYPNDSDGEITVEWNKSKEIQQGVENVESLQHEWELGAGVKTAVSAEAGFSAFGAEAKVSASVEAEVSAKYGEEKHSQDTKSEQTTEEDEKRHNFVVAPHTTLDVNATYEAGTGEALYEKTLLVDMNFRTSYMNIGPLAPYERYYQDWFGGDCIDTPSLLDWLGGYFGQSNNNDFAPGLDITFSTDANDVRIRTLLDEIRSQTMMVHRRYKATLKNATNFTFALTEHPLV